ncbi:uncharacterized protein K460DRAFT_293250 [Cucurbitaria berberidis CBS 394.84]|uniref:Uncharacterized protein n=1 Tax=Cucurbitaria berberidis CBS 394.84 TaxID=1168544 RepID=A0A9P4L4R6_9PLEO|nr:uncharacterized protein K460DRAFT_293250 [Cucurbitaria berberidis CBS 394.84]KAF1841594.1 hypothetical protein K460DRAFT_293250 [Cucurbitaria berberidis CBS 394.84]
MTELKSNLRPYYLEAALASDRADNNDCFILDVGRNDEGKAVASLKRVIEKVDDYLLNVYDLTVPITKLYIVGHWNLAGTEDETEDETVDNEKFSAEEQEWHEAAKEIAKLIVQMPVLKELTWISGLPFVTCIMEKLPTSMTKLILDLGQGIHLHHDGAYSHKAYITPADMKPLLKLTELKELRLFCMHDSLQPIVWENVFRNKSEGGMRVLDLQMAAAPIVRSEHWRKAQDVVGLTVVNEDIKEKEYKGLEGKGVLHYSFGTGEYLDDFCMRKARIASGSDEAKPLSLLCLKLDGFVIDHLPFELELSQIVLLTCGDNCVDAGLRAPKTTQVVSDAWNTTANNGFSHCLIQWPKWTGIFDGQGDQRDLGGNVVSQEAGPSLPVTECPPPTVPLTEKSLHMKELGDSLDGMKECSDFSPQISTLPSSVAISNASTRGSEVPSLTIVTSTYSSQPVPVIDSSLSSSSGSSPGPSRVPDNNYWLDPSSPTSTDGSFEQVSPVTVDGASIASTTSSAPSTTADDQDSKATSFKHKVRRSLDWLITGSS